MRDLARKIVKLYWPFRWWMLGTFGFIAVTQALALVAPVFHGKLIDALWNALGGKGPWSKAIPIAGIAFGISFVRHVVVTYMRETYEIRHLDFAFDRMQNNFSLSRLLGFSIGQHVNENSALKVGVVTKGHSALDTLVRKLLYDVLPAAVTILYLAVALLFFNIWIGVLFLAGAGLCAWFVVRTNYVFKDAIKQMEDMDNDESTFRTEVIENVPLVIAHAQEKRVLRECDVKLGAIQVFAEKIWTRFMRFVIGRNAIIEIAEFAVMCLSIYLVYTKTITVGELVMVMAWTAAAMSELSTLGHQHRSLMRLYASVVKYFEMLEAESDVRVPVSPVSPARFEGRIEFRNVTYRYARRDGKPDDGGGQAALDDVSFTIEPGETVAIVGESGAGKTTVVQALLRAQDPAEGTIFIDGIDLRNLDLTRYREAIGVVDQETVLFDQPLRYNITFGLNGRSSLVTDAELAEVARKAAINRFFPRLENGFDTIIGEKGIKLSGGQRQRVGIARALIKNPAILIFDEATSNLDAKSERLIKESIREAAEGRTTIVIAHRFSTIRSADRIIVLSEGKVVGEGTHAELEENCPEYQELLAEQRF